MRCWRALWSLLIFTLVSAAPISAAVPSPGTVSVSGSLPLAFEENHGQTDGAVKFLARGSGYGIFVARGEVVFVLRDSSAARKHEGASVVRLQFPGADPDAVAEGFELLPGVSRYIRGSDPSRWAGEVPRFARIRVRDLYPGIDLVCYGNQRQLEYDVVVHPGADLSQLRLRTVGGKATIDRRSGDLLLDTSRGVVRQKLPVVFEESEGLRRRVSSSYRIDRDGDIRFVVAEHRRDRTLVIDPVVIYSTYHGGNDQDAGFGIAADSGGNAYVAGYTSSTNFPTAAPYQPANASNYVTDFFDVFVSKFSSDGSTLAYSTYIGGDKDDYGIAIALDSANNAYVTGRTNSVDFPNTAGSYQPTKAGPAGSNDAFVFKLNAAGGLVYSTYVGGDDNDRGEGIAVDASGNAYVDGITASLATFPGTVLGPAGAIDGFTLKLNPSGSALVYSLRIGGSANDSTEAIDIDAAGNAYVAGHSDSLDFPTVAPIQALNSGARDVTLYKINAAGTALLYSTYLGGSGDDLALAVQTDAVGNAYYAGKTNSPLVAATAGYPTSPGVVQPANAGPPGSNDVFVTKLTPAGTIAYSTLVGTARDDLAYGIGVDTNGNATFAGETNLVTGLESDVFLAKLNSTGTAQIYGLLFRGTANDFGRDLEFDAKGFAYATGFTSSTDFGQLGQPPGTLVNPRQPANAGPTDAFVIKFTDSVDLQVTKSDGQTSAVPGSAITYTITVTNPGPFGATDANVTDSFPAELTGTTWTTVVAGGATVAPAAGAGDINAIVSIPVGGSVTFTVMATISPSATGVLTNTATATAANTVVDVDTANNSATDTTLLVPDADLMITKTDGLASTSPGSVNQYTITVTNNGPNPIVGATVADTFPAEFTGVTYTATQTGGATGFTPAGAGNINDTVTLPVGSTITYTASGIISSAATGVLSNTATVSGPSGTTDPDPTNNSATDTTTLAGAADLSITKSDGVTTATPGNSVTYTITVTNSGPSDVVGAAVTDIFPPVITATYTATGAAGTSGYTAAGSGNINDTVTMPAGTTITYTVIATLSSAASGSVSNTATVTAPAGVTDGAPGNNSATDTDTLAAEADLAISKTDGVTMVTGNDLVTYTIVVSNPGPSDVVGATVADLFPAQLTGVTYTSTAAGGATGNTSGSGDINDVVNLPAGSSVTYTASGTVSPSATGTLSNTATVTPPGSVTDPNPANNSATDTDSIDEADLSVTKTDSPDPVSPGGTITYTIAIANGGPADAVAVTLADVVPAGTTFASLTQDSGPVFSCATPAPAATGSVTCTIATLGSGVSAVFTLVVNVDGSAANSTIANTATIDSSTTDTNTGNDAATASTTVLGGPNVFATKSAASATGFETGTPLTYTVVLTNSGGAIQGDNPGDEFTDVLPPGVDLIGATATSGTVTVDDAANTVHFSGVIIPGTPVTITITANVTATSGPVVNQGIVFYDPNLDGINDATRLSDDPSQAGGGDPTTFIVGEGAADIPTLSELALALLAITLALAAVVLLRRR